MDRSYPYSRRLLSRALLRKRMAAVAVAGLLGTAAVFMLAWEPDPIAAAVPAPFVASLALEHAGEPVRGGVRRIYPYSVVPGGVSGQSDLQRVIRTDRVVAAHYASFDAGKARAVVVDKPRAVHVSYRKGDKVYWTAHKVMLTPGETLLSDGRNEMRARCANRISDLPQYPVEAHRPAMEELDQPIERDEGEQYALVASDLPAGMDAVGGMQHHAAASFSPNHAGAAASAAKPATALLLANSSFDPINMGPVSTVNLLGFSGSKGKSPVSGPGAPERDPSAGTETIGGSSSAPAPAPGGSSPGGDPAGTDRPTGPAPGATPAPLAGGEASLPTPVPGADPAPGPVTEPQPALPGPAPEPGLPKPTPEPLAPQTIGPDPVEVPEPGSLWLFALALAAIGVVRRRRRA